MSNRMGEALVKAAMQKAQANASKPGKYPRYAYSQAGIGIHRKRRLTRAEEIKLVAARMKFSTTSPGSEERRAAFAELRELPVKVVEVKYAEIQDHSRYPAERLRNIRADGGGPKEKARAARRVAARGDGGTVLANDNEGIPYEAAA